MKNSEQWSYWFRKLDQEDASEIGTKKKREETIRSKSRWQLQKEGSRIPRQTAKVHKKLKEWWEGEAIYSGRKKSETPNSSFRGEAALLGLLHSVRTLDKMERFHWVSVKKVIANSTRGYVIEQTPRIKSGKTIIQHTLNNKCPPECWISINYCF